MCFGYGACNIAGHARTNTQSSPTSTFFYVVHVFLSRVCGRSVSVTANKLWSVYENWFYAIRTIFASPFHLVWTFFCLPLVGLLIRKICYFIDCMGINHMHNNKNGNFQWKRCCADRPSDRFCLAKTKTTSALENHWKSHCIRSGPTGCGPRTRSTTSKYT